MCNTFITQGIFMPILCLMHMLLMPLEFQSLQIFIDNIFYYKGKYTKFLHASLTFVNALIYGLWAVKERILQCKRQTNKASNVLLHFMIKTEKMLPHPMWTLLHIMWSN